MKTVNKIAFNELLPKRIDLLLCSSSFEERCFSAVQSIIVERIKSALVFYNHDQKDEITINAKKLKKLLPNSKLVQIHSNNPVFTLNNIFNSIEIKSDEDINVVLDTTTFTHEGLLILFKVLNLKKTQNTKLFLIYNSAKEYSTNEIDPEDKWLSKGVGNVRTVIGYSGFMNPAQKNHLIVLFGFEVERTLRVIDIFEPDTISIGVAQQAYSISDEHFKLNKKRHQDLKLLRPQLTDFAISLIDPLDTANQLKEEIEKYKDCNIIIAPMNNKFSTIGTAIAAIENDNIQLCYIPANIYNKEGYSKPSDDFYVTEITFPVGGVL
jgi:hypothetical protein